MKNIVHFALAKLGYRLIRTDRWRAVAADDFNPELQANYEALIRHCYMGFRERALRRLPVLTPARCTLLASLTGTGAIQGMHILDTLAQTMQLPGDVCEFGVAKGTTSALLANELLDQTKCLWLFDSFQGLSKPTAKDSLQDDILGLGSMSAYEGVMSYPENQVRRRLRNISFPEERTRIVAGFVETTLKGPALPSAVAFAFVDMDLYEPIRLALEFLQGRLAVGGIVIIHDYGCFSTGAKSAVDEFLAAHPRQYQVVTAEAAGAMCILRRTAGATAEPPRMDAK